MSIWRPTEKTSFWRRWLPTWLHAPGIILFRLSITAAVIGLGVVIIYFILASNYDLDEVAKWPRATVYYDRNGKELEALDESGRSMVVRGDIPEFMVKALVAREDARFFEHGGVDIRGLARASARNLKDKNFTQGASTLTMQLARNTYEMRAKSLHRKALEIALTLRIESRYSKDEIMTNYLNRIYYGSGAYGVEQAARTYFGKTTSQLHPSECAMIVGIIRGPHVFSPRRNFHGALEQRDQTLARMVDAGFITRERAAAVKALEIQLIKERQANNPPSYALRHVQRELEKIIERENLTLSGIRVHTTLDLGWQTRLESELARMATNLEAEKGWQHHKIGTHQAGKNADYVQFAAVTTETKSGGVLALIGGRDFADSRFDRSRSKRDLGAAFEPFIAAAASDRGKLVFAGKPIQTGRQLGPKEVKRLAKRCGISGPFLTTEDLYRGAVAATPMEMSVGLATLGNKGKKPKPHFISRIEDSEGNVVYRMKTTTTGALSEQAAREALSVLQNDSETRYFTGATASERDAWVLRLGSSDSTAIWIGFDDPKMIANEKRLKAQLDGFIQQLGN